MCSSILLLLYLTLPPSLWVFLSLTLSLSYSLSLTQPISLSLFALSCSAYLSPIFLLDFPIRAGGRAHIGPSGEVSFSRIRTCCCKGVGRVQSSRSEAWNHEGCPWIPHRQDDWVHTGRWEEFCVCVCVGEELCVCVGGVLCVIGGRGGGWLPN